MRRSTTFTLVAAALSGALGTSAASAATAPTRYSLQGGCYALRSASDGATLAGADKVRMQATRLGSYMLYTPARQFLASGTDGTPAPAAAPSPAADWQVDPAVGDTFTLSPASDRSKALTVKFAPADGCATFPEAELNATGTPSKGSLPFGQVGGFMDGHMHWMTFEYLGGNFHCGRPWSPYGITDALPDCSTIEGPQGSAAPIQNTLNFGAPVAPHDTQGWPTFKAWSPENVTYEGIYWRWMQRAWMAGLRLIVMPVNENRILCELQTNRRNSCDEMTTVRKGLDDMNELQDYVDAQAGGPGKGFFQVVRDPFEARKVINEGKMAVVLEIEVSELFGCRGWETSTCDRAQVDRELDEFYDRGVRSSLLLNKFDNPLSGVRFDSGPIGALINGANKLSAGSFWSAQTCDGPLHDNQIDGGAPTDPTVSGALGLLGLPSGSLPTYPPAPHCNTRGLTELGKYVERRMIDKRMIINPDHMSQKGVEQSLTLAASRKYSGVISPHGWMDPGNWPRIYKLGGMAFPNAGSATDYVKAWKKYRPQSTGKYTLGWGWGADLGGLAKQGVPGPAGATAVTYPFKSYDGKVTFERQRTGERTFDYAKDGIAHYGLYADWVNEVGKLGGPKILADMWRSSEAYLDMWERANGVPGPDCRNADDGFSRKGLGQMRLGYTPDRLLRRVGQPQQRTRAWSYCVRSPENKKANATAVFSPKGRVELVGSNARGIKALGIGAGTPVRRLPKRATSFGGSMRLVTSRGATYLFGVSGKKVSFVALPSPALLKSPRALLQYVALLRKAKASQPGVFVPAALSASQRTDGTPFIAREGHLLSNVCLL